MPKASEGNKKSKKNGQKNIYTMSKVNFFASNHKIKGKFVLINIFSLLCIAKIFEANHNKDYSVVIYGEGEPNGFLSRLFIRIKRIKSDAQMTLFKLLAPSPARMAR